MEKVTQPIYDIKEALLETTGSVPVVKETTFTYHPHTYYIANNGKLLGYKRCDNNEVKWFAKTKAFSKTHRKFKKVDFSDVI